MTSVGPYDPRYVAEMIIVPGPDFVSVYSDPFWTMSVLRITVAPESASTVVSLARVVWPLTESWLPEATEIADDPR